MALGRYRHGRKKSARSFKTAKAWVNRKTFAVRVAVGRTADGRYISEACVSRPGRGPKKCSTGYGFGPTAAAKSALKAIARKLK